MIAVAALPLAAVLSGTDFEDPAKLAAGFPIAMTIAAGTSFAAALLAWTTIRDDALSRPAADTTLTAKQLPADCVATLRSRRDPTGYFAPSAAPFPSAHGQGIPTVRRATYLAPPGTSPSFR